MPKWNLRMQFKSYQRNSVPSELVNLIKGIN